MTELFGILEQQCIKIYLFLFFFLSKYIKIEGTEKHIHQLVSLLQPDQMSVIQGERRRQSRITLKMLVVQTSIALEG